MKSRTIIPILALLAAFLPAVAEEPAQPSALEQFRLHNAAAGAIQPAWMGPLVQPSPRLTQGVRFSVSRARTPYGDVFVYGNNHGFSLLGGRRFQLDVDPPSFFRNHSATARDGFGNAGMQVKYLIASGNAQHGNYVLAAMLSRDFSQRGEQNGLLTSVFGPKLAGGRGFGRFNVQTSLGGFLPTGKIAQQGRAIEWHVTGQMHSSEHIWFEVENNAAFLKGGPDDGRTQNFVTPAAFYVVHRKAWDVTHPAFVFAGGMQIATSHFHYYDHNLITEMRILF